MQAYGKARVPRQRPDSRNITSGTSSTIVIEKGRLHFGSYHKLLGLYNHTIGQEATLISLSVRRQSPVPPVTVLQLIVYLQVPTPQPILHSRYVRLYP